MHERGLGGFPGALESNDVVVKNLWLSLDPAMRGWMNDAKVRALPRRVAKFVALLVHSLPSCTSAVVHRAS